MRREVPASHENAPKKKLEARTRVLLMGTFRPDLHEGRGGIDPRIDASQRQLSKIPVSKAASPLTASFGRCD
ncbi:MAG TPA: hypothetical protein VKB16_24260 [Beijerinckiaceae bacterium]|nr:hypothetical protein [Beijerinckiaceae bacterium]